MKQTPLTNADYQRTQAVSSHWLITLLAKSPAECWRKHLDPNSPNAESTDALRLGSLVHCLALTPNQFYREFRIVETRRTKDGKTEWEWTLSKGRIPIRPSELAKAQRMVEALQSHPEARRLLRNGKKERPILMPRPGLLPLKGRLDLHDEAHRRVVELKTIRDLSLIPTALQRYRYLISAAFYADLARAQAVVFVFVQSIPPHEIAVIPVDRTALAEGREQYRDALKRFDECWQSGIWPEAETLPALDDDPLMMPQFQPLNAGKQRQTVGVGDLVL